MQGARLSSLPISSRPVVRHPAVPGSHSTPADGKPGQGAKAQHMGSKSATIAANATNLKPSVRQGQPVVSTTKGTVPDSKSDAQQHNPAKLQREKPMSMAVTSVRMDKPPPPPVAAGKMMQSSTNLSNATMGDTSGRVATNQLPKAEKQKNPVSQKSHFKAVVCSLFFIVIASLWRIRIGEYSQHGIIDVPQVCVQEGKGVSESQIKITERAHELKLPVDSDQRKNGVGSGSDLVMKQVVVQNTTVGAHIVSVPKNEALVKVQRPDQVVPKDVQPLIGATTIAQHVQMPSGHAALVPKMAPVKVEPTQSHKTPQKMVLPPSGPTIPASNDALASLEEAQIRKTSAAVDQLAAAKPCQSAFTPEPLPAQAYRSRPNIDPISTAPDISPTEAGADKVKPDIASSGSTPRAPDAAQLQSSGVLDQPKLDEPQPRSTDKRVAVATAVQQKQIDQQTAVAISAQRAEEPPQIQVNYSSIAVFNSMDPGFARGRASG